MRDLERCPVCGRPLPAERDGTVPGERDRWREEVTSSLAPLRRASLPTIACLLVFLVATAAGSALHHRSAGSALGALVCVAGVVAVCYGRFVLPRHGRPR